MVFHLAQVYKTIVAIYQQVNLYALLLSRLIFFLLFLWNVSPCIFLGQYSADAKFLLNLVSMPETDVLKGTATPIVVSWSPFRGLPEVLAMAPASTLRTTEARKV